MTTQTHEIWNLRFLTQIVNSMADGVFTMDTKGKITSWNQSMEKISGYSAQETLGKGCDILGCSRCFGNDCPAGIDSCGIIERGTSETKECLMRHKNSHDISLIKNTSLLKDEKGEIIGIVETVTDLTELKKAKKTAEEAALRLGEVHQLGNIIGKSHEMEKVFSEIRAPAASESTILIQGESGTGKELVAGAIHYLSERKN